MLQLNNKLSVIESKILLDELKAIKDAQKDIILSAAEVAENVINQNLSITDNGLSQFYNKLSIPKPFMIRLKNQDTKRAIVKEMAQEYDKKNKKLLVRIKENGKKYIRAVLSESYSILDNFDVVEAILKDTPTVNLRSYVNDDFSMKMEIALKNNITLGTEEGKPDNYISMITIENSETGNATLNFKAGVYRPICSNGLMQLISIMNKESIKHIWQNTPMILAALRDTDIYQLEDKTNSIIEMIKNSKGIYVEKPKEKLELLLDDKADKLQERANTFLNNRYTGKRMFDVINAATNAIHQVYPDVHKRIDLETSVYNKAVSMMK